MGARQKEGGEKGRQYLDQDIHSSIQTNAEEKSGDRGGKKKAEKGQARRRFKT